MTINGIKLDIAFDDLDDILYSDLTEPEQSEIDEAVFDEMLDDYDKVLAKC